MANFIQKLVGHFRKAKAFNLKDQLDDNPYLNMRINGETPLAAAARTSKNHEPDLSNIRGANTTHHNIPQR